MQPVSKSEFKAKALEIMREVEHAGESLIITDRGTPKLELKVYKGVEVDPFERLRGTVIQFDNPLAPVSEDDWEASQ